MQQFDALIIGSGQGGGPLAKDLAAAGWKTALVERAHFGGTCINWGCTPTKTMIASARVAHLARRAGDYGITAGEVQVQLPAVQQRKDQVVKRFRNSLREDFQKQEHLTVFKGTAVFSAPHELKILFEEKEPVSVQADHIFIDTGTSPRIPDLEGLDQVPYLTSADLLDLQDVPRHLVILGGGYIGLEFAQMFRRFGTEVTVLEAGDRFLKREDEDVAAAVKEFLEEEGIRILTGAEAQKVEDHENGFRLTYRQQNDIGTIEGTHLLLAVGTTPNVAALNLEDAGVKTDDRGFIQVNERLETNVKGIYALGDVKGGPAFTHISYDDYRILRDQLLGDQQRTTKDRQAPYTMFTDPQLAHVGLHEAEAREQKLNIKVAKLPMSHAARAIETGETTGLMKAIVDADTGRILGATILGREGGEVLAALQVAMLAELPYDKIKNAVFSHPTLAESLNNLFAQLE